MGWKAEGCGSRRRPRHLTAQRAASAGRAGTAWSAPAAASRQPLTASPAGGSALQQTPGGGGGALGTRPARLLPRALALFRPPPGSSERCATAEEESRPQADCPLPPRPGHLPLMPAGRPRPGTAPSRPLPPCPELGRPTARSPGPRPPPCSPGLSGSAPRPRPERAAEERRPIVGREVMRAGSMLIRASQRTRAGNLAPSPSGVLCGGSPGPYSLS